MTGRAYVWWIVGLAALLIAGIILTRSLTGTAAPAPTVTPTPSSAPTATTTPAASPKPTVSAAPATSAAAGKPAASALPTAPAFSRGTVTIQTKSGPVTLNVEIADDEVKRDVGLMNRRAMPPDGGMLFIFNPPANAKQVGFWMKDTFIPLSIAFVEPNLTIEDVQDMQPQSEQPHYAPRDYAYAIEANQGFFASHGVAVGDKVTIQR